MPVRERMIPKPGTTKRRRLGIRRAHDAIAEIHQFTSRSYEWVFEADIEACFDQISHPALMDRVRRRVGDKRVLGLVKAAELLERLAAGSPPATRGG
jgi:RNA-directed DNA polymerase